MKKIPVILLAVLIVVQLAVPVTMIVRKETVIANGKVFRFRTAPIDPADPFRGRYIDLNFEASRYDFTDSEDSIQGPDAYALIREDEEGYAEIAMVLDAPPGTTTDYVKIKLNQSGILNLFGGLGGSFTFPFERFYMDEEKAPHAEQIYRQAQRDTSFESYALVSIWNGGGVITDVLINGKSVRDITPEEMEQSEE
jgi:uncharacterized membrane-anchored protein